MVDADCHAGLMLYLYFVATLRIARLRFRKMRDDISAYYLL